MREVLKLSAWVQQNYDICLFATVCLTPILFQFMPMHRVAQLDLACLALISCAMLYAKLSRRRALRVPKTEKWWLVLACSSLFALLASMAWPSIAFSIFCWILPLTLLTVLFERKHRYIIARQRIDHRRQQQARWRMAKRAVLSEWKDRLRWIAGVQHDMRQPLHALGLLVGHPALGTPSSSSGATQQVVRQMTSCQRWMHDLAENMLEATRLELGEQREMKIGSASSAEICSSIESWVGQLAEAKGLQFLVQVDDVPIFTDIRRLKRVIGNLVFNAVEHTQEGSVSFRYQRRGGVHQFMVQDTGPGMNDSVLSTRFGQQPSGFGSDLPKSGIGLYVVKKLCDEMGWSLSMINGPESGTTFVLELADRLAVRSEPQQGKAMKKQAS